MKRGNRINTVGVQSRLLTKDYAPSNGTVLVQDLEPAYEAGVQFPGRICRTSTLIVYLLKR